MAPLQGGLKSIIVTPPCDIWHYYPLMANPSSIFVPPTVLIAHRCGRRCVKCGFRAIAQIQQIPKEWNASLDDFTHLSLIRRAIRTYVEQIDNWGACAYLYKPPQRNNNKRNGFNVFSFILRNRHLKTAVRFYKRILIFSDTRWPLPLAFNIDINYLLLNKLISVVWWLEKCYFLWKFAAGNNGTGR